MLAGLLERLCAPGAEFAAFQVAPKVRMLNEMLEIAVCRAGGAVEPRGHEDSDRGHAAGMHIHKSEDLRLREPECMQYFTGRDVDVGAKLDDELHADGPVAYIVPGGHAYL